MPKDKHDVFHSRQFSFIDENDKRLLLFAINSGSLVEIELEQLKMDSVDCVSVIKEDEICVWSIASQKLQLLRKRDPKLPTFSLYGSSVSWNNQRLFMSAESDSCLYALIARIKKDSYLIENHLFAVFTKKKETAQRYNCKKAIRVRYMWKTIKKWKRCCASQEGGA